MGVPSPQRSIWAHWTTNPEVRRHILHLTRDDCDVFKEREQCAFYYSWGYYAFLLNAPSTNPIQNLTKRDLHPALTTWTLAREKACRLAPSCALSNDAHAPEPKVEMSFRWPGFSLNGPAKVDGCCSSQPRRPSWHERSSIHQRTTHGTCDNIGDDFCFVQPGHLPQGWCFIRRALMGTSLGLP